VSWRLGGLGDGNRDGRERADNMESARSIFPVLISFGNESDAKVGESVGLPFEIEELMEGGLDVCEILQDVGADWGNHHW
jgi:hypothetical protein